MAEYSECKSCAGYCCAAYNVTRLSDDDIDRISAHLGIPRDRFMHDYVIPHKYDDELKALKFARPCMFWRSGRCGIHSVKPETCANYVPITHFYTETERWTCADWHKRMMQNTPPRSFTADD